MNFEILCIGKNRFWGRPLFGLVLLICLDVTARSLRLFATPWTLDIAQYSLYLITFFGAPWVLREGGHISIDVRSPCRCGCGTRGCIETLAAGPGMARRTRVKLEQQHTLPSLLREMTGGHLSRISPKMIQEAARAHDPVAQSMIDETGFYLGVWLAGMITLLDPEAIVIGGGVAQIGRPLFRKIRETIPQYTINRRFAVKTPLLAAKLQKNVGVYGAASLFQPAGEEAEKD